MASTMCGSAKFEGLSLIPEDTVLEGAIRSTIVPN
jgi:hypothetical protein